MAVYNISAGHNPDGKTACGAIGVIKESTEARNVVKYLIEYLRSEGHTVYDCTCNNGTSKKNVLEKIVSRCNARKSDLDVSIHFNAGANDEKGNGNTTGVEVLVRSALSSAKPAASRICKNVAALGFKNRGVKIRDDLYFLNQTRAVALLVECCFVDDKDDCKIYNAKKMAKAIAEGILNKKIGETSTTNTSKNTSNALIYAGKKLTLTNTPCYVSATSEKAKSNKSGTYYIYSNDVVNNRIKITNSKTNVGKAGQVTGWIDKKYAN